jgi:hypothetical protein
VFIEADEIFGLEWWDGLKLLGFLEVQSGSAIRVDNSLGEQIADGFALLWNVGGEDMIEGAVFSNQHNHLLDGRFGLRLVLILAPLIFVRWSSVSKSAAQRKRQSGENCQTDPRDNARVYLKCG